MSPRALTSRDRRALTLGIAVLVPALIAVRVVRPAVGWFADARAQLEVDRQALARERALLAAEPRAGMVRSAVDSLERLQAARLFGASDDAIAAAQLANYLASVARRTNVWLADAEGRPGSRTATGVRAIQVEVNAESDFQGLVDFLRALEAGDKTLRVDAVSLSARGHLLAPGESADDSAGTSGVVRLRATVVGYASSVDSLPRRPRIPQSPKDRSVATSRRGPERAIASAASSMTRTLTTAQATP